jgi:hypothetical protein
VSEKESGQIRPNPAITDEDLAFIERNSYARAAQLRAMARELRDRRARDLTAEDREALQLAHSIVAVHHAAGRWPCADCAPALAVLAKLLAAAESK